MQTAPEVKTAPLKETLLRKDVVRAIGVNDLFLRLDPAAELAVAFRESLDTHLNAGGVWETYT